MLGSTLRSVWSFLTHRIVLFLICGTLFFAIDWLNADQDRVVRVGPQEIDMLDARWRAQTGTEPTATERRALVDNFIEEEVLSREARRLGLDLNDTIVRRRLAQKMQLLMREQIQSSAIPTEEVKAYIDANPSLFRIPKQISFRQVFLGAAGSAAMHDNEETLTALLNNTGETSWQEQGKASMAPQQVNLASEAQISELFGPDFASSVISRQTIGDWWGPVRSSYGDHYVSITSSLPERIPEFEELRPLAAEAMRRERTEAAMKAAWLEILDTYTVVTDKQLQ